jgi:predicted metal-dependent peptidase
MPVAGGLRSIMCGAWIYRQEEWKMEFENFLQRVGVDAEETLKRFAGRSDILEKFLLKFPEDPVSKIL